MYVYHVQVNTFDHYNIYTMYQYIKNHIDTSDANLLAAGIQIQLRWIYPPHPMIATFSCFSSDAYC